VGFDFPQGRRGQTFTGSSQLWIIASLTFRTDFVIKHEPDVRLTSIKPRSDPVSVWCDFSCSFCNLHSDLTTDVKSVARA
jgi:hypothetical protein